MPSCLFQLAENRVTRISVSCRQIEVDAAGALVFLTLRDEIQDERVETTEKRETFLRIQHPTNRPGDTGHIAA